MNGGTTDLDPAAIMAKHEGEHECGEFVNWHWHLTVNGSCLPYRLAADLAAAREAASGALSALLTEEAPVDRLAADLAEARALMSNLTPEQIGTIKFAAAVIDAYGAGKRTSQAARDLRAMLPAEQPLDLTAIHDHVGESDEETQVPAPTKQWNQCSECDRWVPCRHHPDAPMVGPIPPEEIAAYDQGGDVTPLLITRIAGYLTVVQLVESGVGPLRWAGELRDDDDQPISKQIHHACPDTNGLQQVLARLSVQARIAAVPLDEDVAHA